MVRKIAEFEKSADEIMVFEKSAGEMTVFDCRGETTFGSNYEEVQKNEGIRNQDSTYNFLVHKTCTLTP